MDNTVGKTVRTKFGDMEIILTSETHGHISAPSLDVNRIAYAVSASFYRDGAHLHITTFSMQRIGDPLNEPTRNAQKAVYSELFVWADEALDDRSLRLAAIMKNVEYEQQRANEKVRELHEKLLRWEWRAEQYSDAIKKTPQVHPVFCGAPDGYTMPNGEFRKHSDTTCRLMKYHSADIPHSWDAKWER